MRPGTVGIAVYDANVLIGNAPRYLLLGVAQERLVQAKWSDRLLFEVAGAAGARQRWGALRSIAEDMHHHAGLVRDHTVKGYRPWIERIEGLKDANDRHVLALAIASGAHTIVTANARDFPASVLSAWGVERVSADGFLLRCFEVNPAALVRLRDRYRLGTRRFYESLEGSGCAGIASALAKFGTY